MKLVILALTLLSLTGCAATGKFLQDSTAGLRDYNPPPAEQPVSNTGTCYVSNSGGGYYYYNCY